MKPSSRSSRKTYSMVEAAKKADIHRTTLIRWFNSGKVKASAVITLPRFTEEDIREIKKFRDANYWAMPKKGER